MRFNPLNNHKRNYTHPSEPQYVCLDYQCQQKPARRITIFTYNIEFAKKVKHAVELIKNQPSLNRSDIICLQEMDVDGVKHIADALQFNFVYYPAVKHPQHGRDFGNAILSKWPIAEHQKIILPHIKLNKLQRIAVMANIHIGEFKILAVSVHMDVWLKTEYRTQQMKSIIQSIPDTVKYCIIAGDFNTLTKKNYFATIDPLIHHGFDLATKNIAWSYKHWYILNKKTSLDHIFTKGMRLVETDKVLSKKPSDHFPIWAELEFDSQFGTVI
ncbi:MAG: endonuclease/exonuclease/phosphatase family protein [Candidatus Omnitrophica bacterium]|nr:endonuclease/exonuclease/phosphatase family protein [Candidatus Omnitrophota bacterium]